MLRRRRRHGEYLHIKENSRNILTSNYIGCRLYADTVNVYMFMYIYVYVYTYTYIYIYI